MPTLNYSDALAWVQQHVDYSRTHQQNVAAENFNLGRMQALLVRLGNPQQRAPAIHIAGTKGKGSTAALCAAALQAAGNRTGLYTSPELEEFRERIQINRQPIAEEDFAALVEELQPHAAALAGITAYELQTALAFMHFARQHTTANVIEVGMGGRLDSTNVVTPVVAVITAISLDHTYVLGDTLAAIAREKGGIIKPGIPVVSAPQAAEATTVLHEIATQRAAPLTEVGRDVTVERQGHTLSGQSLTIRYRDEPPQEIRIRLLGPHQAENAATAYAALRVADTAGLTVPPEAIRTGFAAAEWPGRFEILQSQPPLILDGAHNRASAQALLHTLREHFPGQPLALLFGASEDKDIPGMFAELLPETRWLLLMRAEHPRAADSEKLLALAAPYHVDTIAISEIPNALEKALQLAGNGGVALATGSLYPLGAVRAAWRARQGG